MNLFSKKEKEITTYDERNEIEAITTFIDDTLKGNNEPVPTSITSENARKALLSLKEHLVLAKQGEDARTWLTAGLAKFGELLRNKDGVLLTKLADNFLSHLVRYIGANQAAIFVLETEEESSFLNLISCYAYDKKKFREARINPGDGLAGQCVLEKEPIYLKKTPTDYIKITSGLGEATPREVYISPLLVNDTVFGVIELASFHEFTTAHRDLITKLSENLASTIKAGQENERTRMLLEKSQHAAEELKAQEEELRQNMEELSATQEEMQRKSQEIERAAAEMKSILNGVNSTMATIEFDPDGNILTANENFQNTMKYTLAEIQGRHHRMFLSTESANAPDYALFWQTLAKGKSFSGVFKRINKQGKTVWLNAVYNPVLNQRGEVLRIVKFATDVSAQQEMLAEKDGLMEGINTTMATIAFTPEGIIEHANENFLNTMKYRLSEVVGKHHRKFVLPETLQSSTYQTFWKDLAAGRPMTGVFQRVNSEGDIVTLNAIYNPIKDADGNVVRVVKFATELKEAAALCA